MAPRGRQLPVGLVAQAIFTAAVSPILLRPLAERKGAARRPLAERKGAARRPLGGGGAPARWEVTGSMFSSDGQLAFDFDELAREEARQQVDQWQGAPLRFTTDYYPPSQLVEAFEHWCFLHGHFGSYASSHMWHRGIAHDQRTELGEHAGEMFTAELRPDHGEEGPGALLYQMICEPCGWHSIAGDENAAVEAWHDHTLPGWRDLPVVPGTVLARTETGLSRVGRAWITERYPSHMQTPGAPIITERAPHGHRHVPGRSPWGGYDLSSTALDAPPAPRAEAKRLERALSSFEHGVRPSREPVRGRSLTD